MIISCDKCKKKFNVDTSLIDDAGRMLECGTCKHRWFFKKDKSHDNVIKKTLMEKPIINVLKKPIINIIEKPIINVDENKIEKLINSPANRKIKNLNFLNLIPVFIISFIAIIIVIDTFKSPLGKIVPNIELLLYNLYESLKDISLFFKDLI